MSENSKNLSPALPWSVKGISPHARQLAKMAAQQSGQTMGAWLSAAIHQAAHCPELLAEFYAVADNAVRAAKNPPAHSTANDTPPLSQMLQSLDEKLSGISSRLQQLEEKTDTDLSLSAPIAASDAMGKFGQPV